MLAPFLPRSHRPPHCSLLRLTALGGTVAGGGGQATIDIIVTADTVNFHWANELSARGWDGVSPVSSTVTVLGGVQVYSNSTGAPAFRVGDELLGTGSNLTLVLNTSSAIEGMGGAGGAKSTSTASNGSNGGAGGTGLETDGVAIRVENNGAIRGGGGGGGGGGAYQGGVTEEGLCDPSFSTSAGGNGGIGQRHAGSGGAGANGSTISQPCIQNGGKGGGGGSWGNAGSGGAAGSTPSFACDCQITSSNGGSGDAAGKSVVGFSDITFAPQGTLSGPTTG